MDTLGKYQRLAKLDIRMSRLKSQLLVLKDIQQSNSSDEIVIEINTSEYFKDALNVKFLRNTLYNQLTCDKKEYSNILSELTKNQESILPKLLLEGDN